MSYTGRTINDLQSLVEVIMSGEGCAEAPSKCLWETAESSPGACDGGYPCGRPTSDDSDRCELHKEE